MSDFFCKKVCVKCETYENTVDRGKALIRYEKAKSQIRADRIAEILKKKGIKCYTTSEVKAK